MTNFVPYEKLSKKKKREVDTKKRNTWNGLNPVKEDQRILVRTIEIKRRRRKEKNLILRLLVYVFIIK